MEELSEEWEEYSSPEGSSKMSSILSKGQGLGKKILISGIVISSAPLVLPPLVVFSALGLAFSVPFGIFFTSYACTEKLMSKLLSTPIPPSHMLEYGVLSSDDGEISVDAEKDMGFREVIDFEEEEKRLRKDTEEGVEMRIVLPDKGNEGFDQEVKSTGEENYEQGGVHSKEQKPIKDVNEIVIEKRAVMEESKDQEPIDKGYIGTAAEDDKQRGAIEETDKRNVGIVKKNEKPSGSKKKKPIRKMGGAVNKKDEEISNKFEETKGRRNEGNNGDHPVSAGVPESPSGKGSTMPSDKEIYSEEKIWECIGAVRAIVGYKVTPLATCMEELKALYIFTGVKPPVSFKDSSDLVELNDKLRFLMSVVGVK